MRKSTALYVIGSLILWLLVLASTANAAQDSTVVVDNAPIRLEPRNNGKILEYLVVGAEIRISSYPMPGGWYKVRSKTGAYGWIHESFLSVYKPAEVNKKGKEDIPVGPRPERDRKWFLRAVGGFDFFRPDDLNTLFDFYDLNTGFYGGGELGIFVSERVAVEFRSEAVIKDVVARENISGASFNLALRAYPVMLGFDFYFMKLPAMRLSFGVFGGVALATSFGVEGASYPQPNTMVLQRQPFTSLARINLTRPLGRIISVFMEGGYRFLRTQEIDVSGAAAVNGGTEIFGKGGVFKTRSIDLSGVVLGVGIGIHF